MFFSCYFGGFGEVVYFLEARHLLVDGGFEVGTGPTDCPFILLGGFTHAVVFEGVADK